MAKKNEPEDTDQKDLEKEPEPAKEVGIRYIGLADVKELSKGDLYSATGEASLGALSWNSQNDHVVPLDEMNDSTLEYLRSQPDFRVVTE